MSSLCTKRLETNNFLLRTIKAIFSSSLSRISNYKFIVASFNFFSRSIQTRIPMKRNNKKTICSNLMRKQSFFHPFVSCILCCFNRIFRLFFNHSLISFFSISFICLFRNILSLRFDLQN